MRRQARDTVRAMAAPMTPAEQSKARERVSKGQRVGWDEGGREECGVRTAVKDGDGDDGDEGVDDAAAARRA